MHQHTSYCPGQFVSKHSGATSHSCQRAGPTGCIVDGMVAYKLVALMLRPLFQDERTAVTELDPVVDTSPHSNPLVVQVAPHVLRR
jgi:hypothetical protein